MGEFSPFASRDDDELELDCGDVDEEYEPHGEIRELFLWLEGAKHAYQRGEPYHGVPMEILVEGPRGTGKTRGVAEFLLACMEEFPGIRILVVRQTMVSLRTSWQVTWEDRVLGPGDPMLAGASRGTRTEYRHENGSVLTLGGMENRDRVLGADYDIVDWEEVIEGKPDDWESLGGNLRNNRMPFQLQLGTCNPRSPKHWMNKRCARGVTYRIRTRHTDNPSLTPEYLARLAQRTGVRRKWDFEGLWAAAEGAVWSNYDPDVHDVPMPKLVSRFIRGENALREVPDFENAYGIKSYFGSIDWGTTHPGVFQVWGMDAERRIFRCAELYQTNRSLDWWATEIEKLHREFDLVQIVADPENKQGILTLNERLARDREGPLVIPADNRRADRGSGDMAGLDLVRWGFELAADGLPRIFFVSGGLRGRDPALDEERLPVCTEDEIPEYVYLRNDDGELLKSEVTDPGCADHGCDATRYAAMYAWRHDIRPLEREPVFAPGTFGELFGTPSSLAKDKERRSHKRWSGRIAA